MSPRRDVFMIEDWTILECGFLGHLRRPFASGVAWSLLRSDGRQRAGELLRHRGERAL
jgi:hypothetical protein